LIATAGASGVSQPIVAAGSPVTVPFAVQDSANAGILSHSADGLPQTPGGGKQPTDADEHWIPRMMKALGVEHELHISKMPGPARPDGPAGGPLTAHDSAEVLPQEQQNTTETLKSALLHLLQADDVPAAVKDSAQQALQQITGQQLMLSSDKASMFSHITMFVPLMNANGEQTAAVHIQSRKGSRGQIDAQNCRLVFDLRMKSLGDTMIDVQVVDRIVSLRVLNDSPFIQSLLESHREEIAAGLSNIGYQFISLKCGPYPEQGQPS